MDVKWRGLFLQSEALASIKFMQQSAEIVTPFRIINNALRFPYVSYKCTFSNRLINIVILSISDRIVQLQEKLTVNAKINMY